jgi:hypothetical protein
MNKKKKTGLHDHLFDLELLDLFLEGVARGAFNKKQEREMLRELKARGVYIEIGEEGDECPICAMEGLTGPAPGSHVLH